jgi:hypothetical protein
MINFITFISKGKYISLKCATLWKVVKIPPPLPIFQMMDCTKFPAFFLGKWKLIKAP